MPTSLSWPLLLAVIAVGLLGFPFLIDGAYLITLGGSWYYLLVGAGMIATAALLYRRRREAIWLYALVVIGTLAWAVAEIGIDWWPLAARGDVIFLVGAVLLLPPIAGRLGPAGTRSWLRTSVPLVASLGLAAVVGLVAMFTDVHAQTGELAGAASAPPSDYAGVPDGDWRAYGRSSYGDRYSPLTEVTPDNVSRLKVAWTFRTGDIHLPTDPGETTYEVTPLKIGDTVYLCTPHDHAIALDAETGRQRWQYDPKITEYADTLQHLTCRGLSYHEQAPDAPAAPNGECPQRLFLPTADARLIALDARTGQPCPGFGEKGAVNLWTGMPEFQAGFYYATSPPVTTRDLVIVAGEVTDNYSTKEPSGVVRAFDVNTGRLVWNWDAGNPDQTAPIGPDQHYTANSPNSWGVSSADESLGLIYVPMGNETPDEYAPNRSANAEKFSSAIVALEIATGRVRWVFQPVHHDLWDMDIGGQPSLLDLQTPTGLVPVLVASTKQGDIFVLDRRTGTPIVPVEDRPVPQGAAPGDWTSPTQTFSKLSFLPRQPLAEKDMWGATAYDQLLCRIRFKQLRYEGIFTPPSLQGSLVFPGNFGVFDWGGVAVDPVRQIAFANPDYFAFESRLIPRQNLAAEGKHETTRAPEGGRAHVDHSDESGANPMYGTPYAVDLEAFRSPLGLPCQAPPWGYVAGVDLRSGHVVWMHKNGTIRDNSPIPLPFKMGVPSLGGPIVTASGVGFLTATLDRFIRAYDVTTGKQLWESRLPAGAQATPMIYRSESSGREFVVTVAGGHGTLGTKQGDWVIAYALPRSR